MESVYKTVFFFIAIGIPRTNKLVCLSPTGICNKEAWCQNIQYNDTQLNNKSNTILSILTLSIMVECGCAECLLCQVSLMLSLADKLIML